MGGDLGPPPGDPDGMVSAAARWTSFGTDLRDKENSSRMALAAVEKRWTGQRSSDFTQSASGVLVEMVTVRDSLSVAATALGDYARALKEARAQISSLASRYTSIDNRAGPSLDERALQHAAQQQGRLLDQADAIRAELVVKARAAAAALDRESDLLVPHASTLDPAAIRRRVAASVGPTALGGAPRSVEDAWAALASAQALENSQSWKDLPPTKDDAQSVANWWSGLTQQQRDWLIVNDYNTLSGLRGLPATVADSVNRMRLADDQADAQATIAAFLELERRWLAMSPSERANMQDPILAFTRAQLMLRNATGIEKALAQVLPPDAPPVLLLTYDPFAYGGHGRAAIAYGNPDTAANTAVLVPGTGRALSNWPTGDTRRLYREGQKRSGDGPFAVIVDLSYQPPAELWPDALADHYARDGYGNLRDDVTGYEIAHQAATGSHGHTTVIAHSYGTYVTGLALHHGLKVDDVVLVGSPGTGVKTVGGLHMTKGHVFVGLSNSDLVGLADNRFTPAPGMYAPESPHFGATGIGVDNHGSHSDYFDLGSESLQNMAKIATGHSGSITGPHQ